MTAKKFREVMGDLALEDYERWFLATADHQVVLCDEKSAESHQYTAGNLMDVSQFLIGNETHT